MANTTTTRMNNRKAPDTVGRPHDSGNKAGKPPSQPHASPKDMAAAIEAAEHGRDTCGAAKDREH